jgi:hypothetical protein
VGSLTAFDLQALIDEFNLQHLVETGTGYGLSLTHACLFPFKTLSSCDIESFPIEHAKGRLLDDRLYLLQCNSPDFLKYVCNKIAQEEPILFWLDAHFPGADTGSRGFGDVKDTAIRLPLHEELQAIQTGRPLGQDVLLIDDARIWLDDMPYLGADINLGPDFRHLIPEERNIDFVHDIMGHTHDVEMVYKNEGYIKLTPKK